jgi:hypothetical protein
MAIQLPPLQLFSFCLFATRLYARQEHPERQFPKISRPAKGVVTPRGAIRVISQIREIRMKLRT